MVFHSFPWRSWVDKNASRVWIQVVVIRCVHARTAGKQYTKRLLPDFLIPYSPIRLDWILEAERVRREDRSSIEDCCSILGCLELRTVRTHLRRLREAAASISLQLSQWLAHSPQYARLPETDPGQCLVTRLHIIHNITVQAAGAAGSSPIGLRQSLQEYWWHLVGRQSTSCVSRAVRPP